MRWLPKFEVYPTCVPVGPLEDDRGASGWLVQIIWFGLVLEVTAARVVK